ncbi:MAG: J domain-containing protein [Myxococcota bacterium]
MNSDLYALLGVSEDASVEELKKAYRSIARTSHPDRNPGDESAEARFKAAAEAYRVLSDPESRRAYDSGRQTDKKKRTARKPPRSSGKRSFRERGDDLRYTVRLTFEQAALGSRETLGLPDDTPCEDCGGTGAAPGMPSGPCPDCEGEGQRPVPSGFFRRTETCTTCRGSGQVVRETCEQCAGLGTLSGSRKVSVDIPAGVDNGARLRLTGEGRPGVSGGPAGDLIVVIDIEGHPFFERDGLDVVVEVPLSVGQATLGAYVNIPTLDGEMRMRIPPGTQSGRLFRLKGKGLPRRGGDERGDQKVRVKVETPEALSHAQRELMERWAELESLDAEHAVGAYRARMRKLYS